MDWRKRIEKRIFKNWESITEFCNFHNICYKTFLQRFINDHYPAIFTTDFFPKVLKALEFSNETNRKIVLEALNERFIGDAEFIDFHISCYKKTDKNITDLVREGIISKKQLSDYASYGTIFNICNCAKKGQPYMIKTDKLLISLYKMFNRNGLNIGILLNSYLHKNFKEIL